MPRKSSSTRPVSADIFFIDSVVERLGRYALEKKASGDEELRSEVVTGFKVAAQSFFDDRANLVALRRMLK